MQRARAYALAAVNRLADSQTADAVVASLMAVLREKGETSLFPKIAREVAKELERRSKTSQTTVTIARKADEREIRALLSSLSDINGNDIDRIVVDDRLVGGFTVGNASRYLDASYRTKLIKLFNSLV